MYIKLSETKCYDVGKRVAQWLANYGCLQSYTARCISIANPWRHPRIAGAAGQNCGEGTRRPFDA